MIYGSSVNNLANIQPGMLLLSRAFRELTNGNQASGVYLIESDLDLEVIYIGSRADVLRDPQSWGRSAWREAYNGLVAMMVTGFEAKSAREDTGSLDVRPTKPGEWVINSSDTTVSAVTYSAGKPEPIESGGTLAQYMNDLADEMSLMVADVRDGSDDLLIERRAGLILLDADPDDAEPGDGDGGLDDGDDLSYRPSDESSNDDPPRPPILCNLKWESYWDCDTQEWSTASPVYPATCESCVDQGWVYDRCESGRVYYRRTVCDVPCTSDGGCSHQPTLAKPTIGEPPEAASCCDPLPECDCGTCRFDGTTVTVSVNGSNCQFANTDCTGDVTNRAAWQASGTATFVGFSGGFATWQTSSANSGTVGETATACTPLPSVSLSADILSVSYNCTTGRWSFNFVLNGIGGQSATGQGCSGYSSTKTAECNLDTGVQETETATVTVNGDTECDDDGGGA